MILRCQQCKKKKDIAAFSWREVFYPGEGIKTICPTCYEKAKYQPVNKEVKA